MSEIRLSVFTVATPDLSPERLAAAARQAGVAGIEWRYQDVPPDREHEAPSFWGNNRCSISTRWDEEHLAAFGRAAEASGVRSLAVMPYLNCGDLAGTERALQAAKRLGASFIRLGVHRYDGAKPFGELFAEQRTFLREAASLCKFYGVKGLIETHHVTICPSASAACRLLEGADPDWLGVLYDPGNMVYEGFENYRMGMEMLGPYLAHVHAKNAGWTFARPRSEDGAVSWSVRWAGLRQGVVDWARVMTDLRAVGYRGWIGIEDFSEQFGSEEMLAYFADTMGRLLDGGI